MPPEERLEVEDAGDRVLPRGRATTASCRPRRCPRCSTRLREQGLNLDPMSTTFFLGRETLIPSKKPGMALWREKLFALMVRNAQRPTDFFRIPVNRVVELGMQVRL